MQESKPKIEIEDVTEKSFLRNYEYVVAQSKLPEEKRNENTILLTISSLANLLNKPSMLDSLKRDSYIENLKNLYKKIYKKELDWNPKNIETKNN